MIDGAQIPTQPNPYDQQQPITRMPQMTTPPQAQQPYYQSQPPQQQPPAPEPQIPEKPSQPTGSPHPHIYLVAFIIHMIGLIIIFIGVLMVGSWCQDLADEDPDTEEVWEDIGGDIKIIAIGGMIYAGGTILRGVAKYLEGQRDMRDRLKF